MIKCEICGKEVISIKALSQHILNHKITSKEYYDKYFKKENEGICLFCKSETKFKSLKEGYQKYCNLKCSNNSQERKVKFKQSYLKNNVEEINRKKIQTNIEKYGGVGFQIPEQARKAKETMLNKYGVSNYKQKDFINKTKQYLDLFEVEIINSNQYKNNSEKITFSCKKCGKIFEESIFNVCQRKYKCNCERPFSRSSGELELYDFLTGILDNNILTNESISGIEVDFLIPDKNIAIEYNGLYWHSEQILKEASIYHLEKLEKCNNRNLKLIQIFEDEWLLKKEIVKSRLKTILHINKLPKVYARQCYIKEIPNNEKELFLERNHLQGTDISKIRLGAFYNNKLVSVMTFRSGNIAKGSKSVEGIYELSRFCTDIDFHVIGIASKLLNYFKRNYNWKEIFSYADRRWSDGNLYYKLGFNLEQIIKPNYWYTKDGLKRIHRFSLRKRNNEPEEIPEWILRKKDGFYRIWDAGNLKFSMINLV